MNDFFEVNLFQDYHENQLTVLWHLFLEGSNPQCFLQAQLLGGKSVRWPKSNSKYSYDLQFSNIWVFVNSLLPFRFFHGNHRIEFINVR